MDYFLRMLGRSVFVLSVTAAISALIYLSTYFYQETYLEKLELFITKDPTIAAYRKCTNGAIFQEYFNQLDSHAKSIENSALNETQYYFDCMTEFSKQIATAANNRDHPPLSEWIRN